ncbi:MAG TPA: hypothetical protein VG456_05730 [Candidatus Sulfopaludibacter sp.]|nr:hypothetical protein [Candidatus Sulfopaludibacter sp.]
MQEQKEKAALDNPGGEDVMAQVGGKQAGLPFLAFLDAQGDTIVNSIYPGDDKHKPGNIGHPSEPHEVDWFLVMVKKAAPDITSDEMKLLENYLRNQKK